MPTATQHPADRLRALLGSRLRERRTALGMTLRDVTDVMRQTPGITITEAAVSDWERGKATPRPHHQLAIAAALRVPHSALFGLDGEVVR